MRVRRVSRHLHDQNCTAVFLDLFIVMVGVFIGIQLSDWNEARLGRLEGSNVLVCLEQDFEQALRLTTRSIDTHRRNLRGITRLR